jgi:hypothetical protein
MAASSRGGDDARLTMAILVSHPSRRDRVEVGRSCRRRLQQRDIGRWLQDQDPGQGQPFRAGDNGSRVRVGQVTAASAVQVGRCAHREGSR